MAAPVVELPADRARLRRAAGVARRRAADRARRVARVVRRQRRRQDDLAPHRGGLLRPSRGEARIEGVSALTAGPALRRRVGFLSHRPLVWGGLTARREPAPRRPAVRTPGGRRAGRHSSGWASPRTPASGPAISPRGSASDWAWPAPSSPNPICCCSTSRTRGSTERHRAARYVARGPARLGDDRARHPRSRARPQALPERADADGWTARTMTEAPGTLRAAVLLARKDLLLEARSPELVAGVGLFSLAALVGLHFAVAGDGRAGLGRSRRRRALGRDHPGATLALSRAFAAERDAGIIDALLLTPVDRERDLALEGHSRWARCSCSSEPVVVPLHWLFFFAHGRGWAAAALGRSSGGLAAGRHRARRRSARSSPPWPSAARQREVLLPLLFLPVATPLAHPAGSRSPRTRRRAACGSARSARSRSTTRSSGSSPGARTSTSSPSEPFEELPPSLVPVALAAALIPLGDGPHVFFWVAERRRPGVLAADLLHPRARRPDVVRLLRRRRVLRGPLPAPPRPGDDLSSYVGIHVGIDLRDARADHRPDLGQHQLGRLVGLVG